MKRSGFTMVELIFVIVIIGILAATALPRFDGVRDHAKSATELSAMSSMDGAIVSEIEFNGADNVRWHNVDIPIGALSARYNAGQAYDADVNIPKKVLSKILKKNKEYVIRGAASSNGSEIVGWGTSTNPAYDVLFITGPASDPVKGIKIDTNIPGSDVLGKPDSNDLWVFNPNNFDINITSSDATYVLHQSPTVVPAQSIALLDMNGTAQLSNGSGTDTNIRSLNVARSDSTATQTDNDVLEIRH